MLLIEREKGLVRGKKEVEEEKGATPRDGHGSG